MILLAAFKVMPLLNSCLLAANVTTVNLLSL